MRWLLAVALLGCSHVQHYATPLGVTHDGATLPDMKMVAAHEQYVFRHMALDYGLDMAAMQAALAQAHVEWRPKRWTDGGHGELRGDVDGLVLRVAREPSDCEEMKSYRHELLHYLGATVVGDSDPSHRRTWWTLAGSMLCGASVVDK